MIANVEILNNMKDDETWLFDEYMWFIESKYNNIIQWIKEYYLSDASYERPPY